VATFENKKIFIDRTECNFTTYKLIKDKKNVNDLMKEANFNYNKTRDLDDIYNKLKLFTSLRPLCSI